MGKTARRRRSRGQRRHGHDRRRRVCGRRRCRGGRGSRGRQDQSRRRHGQLHLAHPQGYGRLQRRDPDGFRRRRDREARCEPWRDSDRQGGFCRGCGYHDQRHAAVRYLRRDPRSRSDQRIFRCRRQHEIRADRRCRRHGYLPSRLRRHCVHRLCRVRRLHPEGRRNNHRQQRSDLHAQPERKYART